MPVYAAVDGDNEDVSEVTVPGDQSDGASSESVTDDGIVDEPADEMDDAETDASPSVAESSARVSQADRSAVKSISL